MFPKNSRFLFNLFKNGNIKIVLDLEPVKIIYSEGIGELIRLHKKTRGLGGELRLCNLNQSVNDALKTANLLDILSIYKNTETAVTGIDKRKF